MSLPSIVISPALTLTSPAEPGPKVELEISPSLNIFRESAISTETFPALPVLPSSAKAKTPVGISTPNPSMTRLLAFTLTSPAFPGLKKDVLEITAPFNRFIALEDSTWIKPAFPVPLRLSETMPAVPLAGSKKQSEQMPGGNWLAFPLISILPALTLTSPAEPEPKVELEINPVADSLLKAQPDTD